MDSSNVMDGSVHLLVNGSLQSDSVNVPHACLENKLDVDEEVILDDWDSYWNDLNARLTISRMVSDSVIKGIVNAVVEEAAEKISLKEAELTLLNERVQSHESVGTNVEHKTLEFPLITKVEAQKPKFEFEDYNLDKNVDSKFTKKLVSLRIAVEENLQRLKEGVGSLGSCSIGQGKATEKLQELDGCVDALKEMLGIVCEQIDRTVCLFKVSICEQQSEEEIRKETGSAMVQRSLKDLYDEFERQLCEQRILMTSLNNNWQKQVDELSTLRQELDTLSNFIFSSEPAAIFSQNSLENLEEWEGTKRRDNFPWKLLGNNQTLHSMHSDEECAVLMDKSEVSERPTPEVADAPQIKGMTSEELIAYYKSEMTKMKRQHELTLQEKTEELFSLKREFLKEKGSSLLNFKREKELEQMRKKIPEFILKLDDILLENKKLLSFSSNQDILYNLKERIDTLFAEYQRLQSLLSDKRKEVTRLNFQVSDAVNQLSLYSPVEARLLEQIKKLESNMEDVKTEIMIGDEVRKCVLRELVGEHTREMEDLILETVFIQDNYLDTYRDVVFDAISSLNSITIKCYEEKDSLTTMLSEKEKLLHLQVEENKKLKQLIESLTTSSEEKEKFALEAKSKLMQQKEQLDLVCQELNMLRDQVAKQEILISEKKKEFDSASGRLDETLQQVHCHEVEITSLNQNINILLQAMKEAEKQKELLHGIIQEKEMTFSSALIKEKEHRTWVESVAISMAELSEVIADCECRLTDNIARNITRLDILNNQCNQLLQQANLLKRRGLWYKQIYEIRCSDLQKAEAEVDLLGDEVDGLTKLLERIYVALDFYSPVLQHYPGVMEVLKLVRRELKE